jgi:hypothetical protein
MQVSALSFLVGWLAGFVTSALKIETLCFSETLASAY